MSAITSRTSSSSSIRRAAGPSLSGKTGWWTMRPLAWRSAHTAFGNEKCAAWSPWRWPISRRPTRNANSPRRPGPDSTPGQDVTSRVMSSLADMAAMMLPAPARRQGQLVLGRSLHADERVQRTVREVLVALDGDEPRALVDRDRPGVEGGDMERVGPGRRERHSRFDEGAAQAASGQSGAQA